MSEINTNNTWFHLNEIRDAYSKIVAIRDAKYNSAVVKYQKGGIVEADVADFELVLLQSRIDLAEAEIRLLDGGKPSLTVFHEGD